MPLQMKDPGVTEKAHFLTLYSNYQKGYWIEVNFEQLAQRAGSREMLLSWFIWNGIKFIYLPFNFPTKDGELVNAGDFATVGMSRSRLVVGNGIKLIPENK